MKTVSGIVLIFFVLLQGSAFAGEQGAKEKWLKELRSMVGKIVPKKAPADSATAVSGVRGAGENEKDALYWRGKKENLSEAEVSAFTTALAEAEAGKAQDAARKFDEFQKKYPASPLAKDAKLTAKKLRE